MTSVFVLVILLSLLLHVLSWQAVSTAVLFEHKKLASFNSHKGYCLQPSPVHADPKKVQIAVAFYGLSRCWNCTYPSFQRRVFDVLTDKQVDFDVFWHSYDTKADHLETPQGATERAHKLVNCSNESTLKRTTSQLIEVSDLAPMTPCHFNVNCPKEISDEQFRLYMEAQRGAHLNRRKDIWNDNFYSVKNALLALYSQQQVYLTIEEHTKTHRHNIPYDFILLLRPDTVMIKDLILPFYTSKGGFLRTKIRPATLWVPDFQAIHGYNDRAAMGTPKVMKLVMNRLESFRSYPKPIVNSEAFLKVYMDVILQQQYVRVIKWPLKMVRIRDHGFIVTRDATPDGLDLPAADVDYWNCVNKTEVPFSSKYTRGGGTGTSTGTGEWQVPAHTAFRHGDTATDMSYKKVGSFQRAVMPQTCGRQEKN